LRSRAWGFRCSGTENRVKQRSVAQIGFHRRHFRHPNSLFTHGERQVDMFVVLDGEVDIFLPTANGESKVNIRFRSGTQKTETLAVMAPAHFLGWHAE
jgi:CRP-like cAMP-binding protein